MQRFETTFGRIKIGQSFDTVIKGHHVSGTKIEPKSVQKTLGLTTLTEAVEVNASTAQGLIKMNNSDIVVIQSSRKTFLSSSV